MKLTADMLRSKDACPDQVAVFLAEWPDGTDVTEASIMRARSLGLDVDWFTCRFLPAPAFAEYLQATNPAFAEYQQARDTAWRDTVWAKYHRAIATVWAEYHRAIAPALVAAYDAAQDPREKTP